MHTPLFFAGSDSYFALPARAWTKREASRENGPWVSGGKGARRLVHILGVGVGVRACARMFGVVVNGQKHGEVFVTLAKRRIRPKG